MDLDLLGLSALVSGRVSKDVEEKRWNHCKGCTFLLRSNRCKKCGCFMKAKVKFKGAECPIGIWNKVE
jgi:predicted Zn-ribbon and HTH transcriptional regulator